MYHIRTSGPIYPSKAKQSICVHDCIVPLYPYSVRRKCRLTVIEVAFIRRTAIDLDVPADMCWRECNKGIGSRLLPWIIGHGNFSAIGNGRARRL